jgi:hypothetical protein
MVIVEVRLNAGRFLDVAGVGGWQYSISLLAR